jgi:hypothetical protein
MVCWAALLALPAATVAVTDVGGPRRRLQSPLPATCTSFAEMGAWTAIVNPLCCDAGAGVSCSATGFPNRCSDKCAAVLRPMLAKCGPFLGSSPLYGAIAQALTTAVSTCPKPLTPPPPPVHMKCDDMSDFNKGIQRVNAGCCGDPGDDCSTGLPKKCDAPCAAVLIPFKESCTKMLSTGIGVNMMPMLEQAVALCHANSDGSANSYRKGPCDPNPCRNGAKCLPLGGGGGGGHRRSLQNGSHVGPPMDFSCICRPGFMGSTCAALAGPSPPLSCVLQLPSVPETLNSWVAIDTLHSAVSAASDFVRQMAQFDWHITKPKRQCIGKLTSCSALQQDKCQRHASQGCDWCTCNQYGSGHLSRDGSPCICPYNYTRGSGNRYSPSCAPQPGHDDHFCDGTSTWISEPQVFISGDTPANQKWAHALQDIHSGLELIATGLAGSAATASQTPLDFTAWIGDTLQGLSYSGASSWQTVANKAAELLEALDKIDMRHAAAILEGKDYRPGDSVDHEYDHQHQAYNISAQVCRLVADGLKAPPKLKPAAPASQICQLSDLNLLDAMSGWFDLPSVKYTVDKMSGVAESVGQISWTLFVDGEEIIKKRDADDFSAGGGRISDMLRFVSNSLPMSGPPKRPDSQLDIIGMVDELLDTDWSAAAAKCEMLVGALKGVDWVDFIHAMNVATTDSEEHAQADAFDRPNWDWDAFNQQENMCSRFNSQASCMAGCEWGIRVESQQWVPGLNNTQGRERFLWPLAKDDPKDAPKIVSLQQMEAFASKLGLCLHHGYPDQCAGRPSGWYPDVTPRCHAIPTKAFAKASDFDEFKKGLDVVHDFCKKANRDQSFPGMPLKPQPDGKCHTKASIPNVLFSMLDNDKLREALRQTAAQYRFVADTDWSMSLPGPNDKIWFSNTDTSTYPGKQFWCEGTEADARARGDFYMQAPSGQQTERCEGFSGAIQGVARAEASLVDQIAANIPAGGGPNDKSRFGQSPANFLDNWLWTTSMDLHFVATEVSTLTTALRTVDWAAAIYDLTGENKKDPAFMTQAWLWLIDTVAHKVKDASVSYKVPARPRPTCRNPLWPWSNSDHRTGLFETMFDSAKVRQVLVNGADLASKVSRVDWRTTTDHHPTCAVQGKCQDLSKELCGTEPGRNVDYHYGSCYWNNYDPVTYMPRDCARFPCCDGGSTWCARNRRPHRARSGF